MKKYDFVVESAQPSSLHHTQSMALVLYFALLRIEAEYSDSMHVAVAVVQSSQTENSI